MNQELLEKHEPLVVELANVYLDNLELELGKQYKNNSHELNASLSDDQYAELQAKYDIPNDEFANLYLEFQNMKPTNHLKKIMDAFTASGGNIDIEPNYDENTQRLKVAINFIIKGHTLETIQGLSPLENVILKMNAMLQVESLLLDSDSNTSPSFE